MRTALLLSMRARFSARSPFPPDQAVGQSASHGTPRRAASRAIIESLCEALRRRVEALKQAVQRESQKNESKSKIVCGMTIIEADPYFDQKMKVTPPKDANVRYTIRAVDPAVCNSRSK